MLALHPPAHATAVRSMRRSAAGMARHQRRTWAVSPMPARPKVCRSLAGHWPVRWRASCDRSRDEVPGSPVAREAAGRLDAEPRRRHAGWRVLGCPRAAPSRKATSARIQSGSGPRPSPRPACRLCARARPRHAVSDRPAGVTAASEYEACLCGNPSRVARRRFHRRAD